MDGLMSKVEEYEYKGWTIRISHDEDAQNPRIECDNLGTLLCWHSRRRNLGDVYTDRNGDMEKLHEVTGEDFIWLPVYAYEHGGITLNTTGFSCPWDSGQVGVVYVHKNDAMREFSDDGVFGPDQIEKVKNLMRSEIETYDQWLQGFVYGYEVIKFESCGGCGHKDMAVVDSCWGLYGLDYCKQEAQSYIDHLENKKVA
jgi:hypothetical protein